MRFFSSCSTIVVWIVFCVSSALAQGDCDVTLTATTFRDANIQIRNAEASDGVVDVCVPAGVSITNRDPNEGCIEIPNDERYQS